jgi:hypothetical protein
LTIVPAVLFVLADLLPHSAASAGTEPYVYRPAAARIVSCAHAGKARPLPRSFPANFPLPARSAITAGVKLSGGTGARITGFIPLRTLTQARAFFVHQLPREGFTLMMFDSEAGFEVESGFAGHGWVGRWRTRVIPHCPGALSFSANAIR